MKNKYRTGSIVTLIVTILPVLLTLMAYAIHVAYVESVQSRVQTVVDCAARSAGKAYAETGSSARALSAARQAAQRNPVAGVIIPIEMGDLEFGVSQRESAGSRYTFQSLPPTNLTARGNSVRLTTNTLSNANPPLLQPIFPTFGINAPIRPLKVATNTQGTLDVALVLDRSGSMLYASTEPSESGSPPVAMPTGWTRGDPAFRPSRWTDTCDAVEIFVDYLESSSQREKVSLSTYSSNTSTELQLTHNLNSVASSLDVTSDSFQGGSTAIGLGLQEGMAALTDPARSRSWAVRVMILMTDGIHNTGIDPELIVDSLQENGITLFTVTFGDEADEARMQNLAEACGGLHFNAGNARELQQAFREIGKRLPSLLTQ
jgi:Ca-activated chloride channel homolog